MADHYGEFITNIPTNHDHSEADWFDVTVTYNLYKGDPGVYAYSNGDPGYPPTGDELDNVKCLDKDGYDHFPGLSAKDQESIHEECFLNFKNL